MTWLLNRLPFQDRQPLQVSFRAGHSPNALLALTFASLLAWLIYILWIVQPLFLPESLTKGRLDVVYIYRGRPYHQARLLASFLALGLLYLWGWWAVLRLSSTRARKITWIIVLAGSLACAITLLYLYPFDAADIFDNIMHGRIQAVYGGNPFVQIGKDFPQDPFFAYMAWEKSPSAYGPLWEMLAGVVAGWAGDGVVTNVLAFKLLPGVFWLASVSLVAAFLRKYAPEQSLSGVYLLACNPMVLYATFGNGHNDIVMVFWVLVAIWAVQARHYTTAVLALLVGALVKFIPLLLLPTAIWIALKQIHSQTGTGVTAVARPAAKYLLLTGLLGLVLVGLLYSPFWDGVDTLSIARRARLYTSSLPAIAYHVLAPELGVKNATQLVSRVATAATALFVLWRTWRLGKETPDFQDRFDRGFVKASFDILVFYLLVTCMWFQQWYTVWLVGVAAVLTYGGRQRLGVFFSLAAFSKQLLIAPLLFDPKPSIPQPEFETIFTLSVLGLPWLYALVVYFGFPRTAALDDLSRPNPGDWDSMREFDLSRDNGTE